jgi:hypothetical protein
MTLPISIIEVDGPGGPKHYVAISTAGAAFERGLIPEQIVGQLASLLPENRPIDPDGFASNPAFVDFLHEVIRGHSVSDPELIASAIRQVDGWIYVLDGRTPTPDGAVPPEDILGAFQVRAGQIVQESYQPNAGHKILSRRGFVQVPSSLQQRLLDELAKRV